MDIGELFMRLMGNAPAEQPPMMDLPVGGKPKAQVDDGPIRQFDVGSAADIFQQYNLPMIGQALIPDHNDYGAPSFLGPIEDADFAGMRRYYARKKHRM